MLWARCCDSIDFVSAPCNRRTAHAWLAYRSPASMNQSTVLALHASRLREFHVGSIGATVDAWARGCSSSNFWIAFAHVR